MTAGFLAFNVSAKVIFGGGADVRVGEVFIASKNATLSLWTSFSSNRLEIFAMLAASLSIFSSILENRLDITCSDPSFLSSRH